MVPADIKLGTDQFMMPVPPSGGATVAGEQLTGVGLPSIYSQFSAAAKYVVYAGIKSLTVNVNNSSLPLLVDNNW